MKVKIKLGNGALMPKKAHPSDAAYDLYTSETIYLESDGRKILPIRVSIQLPNPCGRWYWRILKLFGFATWYYCAKILPRSGCSVKGMSGKGDLLNWDWDFFDTDVIHGLVDQPYRGEMGVIVKNNDKGYYIPKGTRVAQMTIERTYHVDEWEVVGELDKSERDGGFGKSGV